MSYLDYHSEFNKFIDGLKAIDVMVLATSAADRVTARSISVVAIEDCIYFQTDKIMDKVDQIKKNKKVALCAGNIQIEGRAEIIGHWESNREILKEYKKKHNSAYEKYKNFDREIVIRIKPIKIKKWEYLDGKPYIYELDIDRKIAGLEEYKLDS